MTEVSCFTHVMKVSSIEILVVFYSSLSSAIYFQEEIIPENYRQKVAEEEKAKEMEDLYLPPRSRKTLQQINQSESDGEIFLLSFYFLTLQFICTTVVRVPLSCLILYEM